MGSRCEDASLVNYVARFIGWVALLRGKQKISRVELMNALQVDEEIRCRCRSELTRDPRVSTFNPETQLVRARHSCRPDEQDVTRPWRAYRRVYAAQIYLVSLF